MARAALRLRALLFCLPPVKPDLVLCEMCFERLKEPAGPAQGRPLRIGPVPAQNNAPISFSFVDLLSQFLLYSNETHSLSISYIEISQGAFHERRTARFADGQVGGGGQAGSR